MPVLLACLLEPIWVQQELSRVAATRKAGRSRYPGGMTWTPRRAMLLLVAGNLCFAGTYVAGKAALGSVSPMELNCLRFGIACLAFLPLLWRYRTSVRIERSLTLPHMGGGTRVAGDLLVVADIWIITRDEPVANNVVAGAECLTWRIPAPSGVVRHRGAHPVGVSTSILYRSLRSKFLSHRNQSG